MDPTGGQDRSCCLDRTGAAEAELARSVTARAKRCLVAVGHTKFGQTAPMVACPPEAVDLLVTDAEPRPNFRERLEHWDIELVVAKAKK